MTRTQGGGLNLNQLVATNLVGDYIDTQRKELYTQVKNTQTDQEKLRLQSALTDLRRTEQALNILVGAVTGAAEAAAGKEILSSAAEQMRALMIEDSRKFKGITDGVTTLTNISGESVGDCKDEDGEQYLCRISHSLGVSVVINRFEPSLFLVGAWAGWRYAGGRNGNRPRWYDT